MEQLQQAICDAEGTKLGYIEVPVSVSLTIEYSTMEIEGLDAEEVFWKGLEEF